MKLNDYNQLVEFLKSKNQAQQIKFIQDYFLENVKIYYPRLIWNDFRILLTKKENEGLTVAETKKQILQEKLKELEFYIRFENLKILKIRKNILKIFLRVCKQEKKNSILNKTDLSWNFNEKFLKVYKPEDYKYFKNGLLQEGISANFSHFIKKLCDDLGIHCKVLKDENCFSHSWNIIELDGQTYHFDMVYALFVRDGYKDWGVKGLTPKDFMMIEEHELLLLSPRKLEKNLNIEK